MDTRLKQKPRYELLDGLRGVAALMVIIYHLYECFPMESWPIGHGYLAVDFFFILSGFVIGYAYDDRWSQSPNRQGQADNAKGGGLTFWGFVKRRLARLHPMVVIGVAWGMVCFLIQGGTAWDGTQATISALMISILLALFLIPCAPGGMGEIRGNGEMFPLNGPHWSLFFEYIGNVVYALLIRRLSTRVLALFTALLAMLFSWFFISDTVGYGNIGVGWTLADGNFWGGMLRMGCSYSIGLLMSRGFINRFKIGGAFWWCTFVIVIALSIPLLGAGETAWINCLYEVLCILVVFPVVVRVAASGKNSVRYSSAICTFLGDISYPLYAIHYPTMYLFYHYIGFPDTWRTPGEYWGFMVALLVGNIVLAYLVMRFYDKPVRRWLSKKITN